MTEVDDTALDELIEQAHQGDDCALVALIARAERGDQAATGELCRIASRALYAGGPIEMNPALRRYIAASLSRVDDVGLFYAFAPMIEQSPEAKKKRRRLLNRYDSRMKKALSERRKINEMAEGFWSVRYVDAANKTTNMKKSKCGEIGPVFGHVGEKISLKAGQVKKRDYAWKSYRKPTKTPKNR